MRASPIFRRLSLIVPAACLAALFAAACRPGAEKSADRAAATAVFPLEEATIAGLQEMMGSGRAASESLVSLYLSGGQATRNGPGLNAVIGDEIRRLGDRPGARPRAQGQGSAGAASRHPDPHQGQHRYATACRRPPGRSHSKGISPRDAFS